MWKVSIPEFLDDFYIVIKFYLIRTHRINKLSLIYDEVQQDPSHIDAYICKIEGMLVKVCCYWWWCDDGNVGCLPKMSILKLIPYINIPANSFLLCYHCTNKFLEKSTLLDSNSSLQGRIVLVGIILGTLVVFIVAVAPAIILSPHLSSFCWYVSLSSFCQLILQFSQSQL